MAGSAAIMTTIRLYGFGQQHAMRPSLYNRFVRDLHLKRGMVKFARILARKRAKL
jgi:hypothetical protein